MLIVKNRTVIVCIQLSDTETCDDEKWRHFRKAGTLHFNFLDEYSKLYQVKIMGALGTIKAIWWNKKINLIYMCIWTANKFANTQKDLTGVKILQKVLGRGLLFWNTVYRQYISFRHFAKTRLCSPRYTTELLSILTNVYNWVYWRLSTYHVRIGLRVGTSTPEVAHCVSSHCT